MAEAALFSLATKLLGVMSSPAYERLKSMRGAMKELGKLKKTIQTIKAVLIDAEKRQVDSAAVKDWIQRVRDVLYEADDLFDDVATQALLKDQMKESKLKKVKSTFSRLNPIVSNDSVAKRVKVIKDKLDDLSKDISHFDFVKNIPTQVSGLRKRVETTPFIEDIVVIGRDDEKKAILEFLCGESDIEQISTVPVIGIVGIGGMGKTTLAQLIYNDELVQKRFPNRWWACISDVVGETDVLNKIARSIDKDFGSDPKVFINNFVSSDSNYLIVLDDVWDNNPNKWVNISSLLSRRATVGSKIIVTTRFEFVPKLVQKDSFNVYKLNGLSPEKAVKLFDRIAFSEEQAKDISWTDLRTTILKKCANVPLAIKSIASLVRDKESLEACDCLNDIELSKIEGEDSIMSTLRLSYDHLLSDLKHCFAYCSLFPQDHRFVKEDLICQWIAQGYVTPMDHNKSFEKAGNAYFMELLRRCFFQEAKLDEHGEIESCKMHDLIHDLAKDVAGAEVQNLTGGWDKFQSSLRHLGVCFREDSSKIDYKVDANGLRSCLFNFSRSTSPLALDLLLTKLKLLRALGLRDQGIENVPRSIGELKHLRYLDLSRNEFTFLPDSLTKLVNLLTLDIHDCRKIEALPSDFRKLINLRHLYNSGCCKLKSMPCGLGELTCLQRLSWLKVGKETGGSTQLDWMSGSTITGGLDIQFDTWTSDWNEDEEGWQLPATPRELKIRHYPGRRIQDWKRGTEQMLLPNQLVRIIISFSRTVKHLPGFRRLPHLKTLSLAYLEELEYVEEEEEAHPSPSHNAPFFPRLVDLSLIGSPKMRGWLSRKESGGVEGHSPSFPLLSGLFIYRCGELKSMPLCPSLVKLRVDSIKEELMQQLLSGSASNPCCPALPSSLAEIIIHYCDWLQVFSYQVHPSLCRLGFNGCANLRRLELAPRQFNFLQELNIMFCKGMELWEGDERGVDWDSLPNLRQLNIYGMGRLPPNLPHSLQLLRSVGQLQFDIYNPHMDPNP